MEGLQSKVDIGSQQIIGYLNLNSNCYNVNFNLKTYLFRLDEFAANVATIQDLMTELQKEDLTSEEYKDLQSKYQVSIQFFKSNKHQPISESLLDWLYKQTMSNSFKIIKTALANVTRLDLD